MRSDPRGAVPAAAEREGGPGRARLDQGNRRVVPVILLCGCVAACGGGSDSPPGADTVSVTTPAPASARPADSLALEAPGGVTVWFTVARESKDSAGTPCLERALEIRRDTARAGVPLLYTREAPTLIDAGHMRAVLYNNCQPGPAYRVDFATVSPQRMTR